ncbi:hypothetical protein ACLB2K_020801 [Fragaria x ananassa]
MEETTHYEEAARTAAEMKFLEQDRLSNLNPTISSSKDERAASKPVADLLLPHIGSGWHLSVVQSLSSYCLRDGRDDSLRGRLQRQNSWNRTDQVT